MKTWCLPSRISLSSEESHKVWPRPISSASKISKEPNYQVSSERSHSTPGSLCMLLLKGPNQSLLKERQSISLINWALRSSLPGWSSHSNLRISCDVIIKLLEMLQQPASEHLLCTSQPGRHAVVKCQVIFSLAVGSNCGCVDSCQLAGLGLAYLPSGLLSIQASAPAFSADTVSWEGLLSEEPRLWFSSLRVTCSSHHFWQQELYIHQLGPTVAEATRSTG